MGIKDRVGIKRTRGNTPATGTEGAPAVDIGSDAVDPGTGKLTQSFAAPSIRARPVVRTKSPARGDSSAGEKEAITGVAPTSVKVPTNAKAPLNGKAAAGAKAPVKGKVVLEAKGLLDQAPPLVAKPVARIKPPPPKNFYDCSRCPGYCCSYPRIEVKPSDVRRLAAYHGISVEKAERKFTRIYMDDGKPERILRHQKDTVYKTICRFFDTDLRRCTIYEGRPQVCREYPNGRHCGYYTFIKFERKHQDDDTFIPSA